MKKITSVFLYIFAILYPVLVFTFLVIFKIPIRILSLCILVIAFAFFLSFTGSQKKEKGKKNIMDWKPLFSSILLLVAGLGCFFTQQILFLKLYSVTVSLLFLIIFGSTLFFRPTIIFRFATLGDKSIIGSTFEDNIKKYCTKVTIIWCCFFILNATISTVTAFSKNIFKISDDLANTIWSIYNGGVSYALTGLLFLIEFTVRYFHDRKIPRAFPVSAFKSYSRKTNQVLCLNEKKEKTSKLNWKTFLLKTAVLRKYFSQEQTEKWILKFNDNGYFLITLIALIQTKKTPYISFENIDEENKDSEMKSIGDTNGACAVNIRDILDLPFNLDSKEIESLPKINSNDIKLFFSSDNNFTSKNLNEIENEISIEIENNVKNLVPQKKIYLLQKQDTYEYTKTLLRNFTLCLKFYR